MDLFHLEDYSPQALGDGVLLLDEERVARHGIVITAGVHVGDSRQGTRKLWSVMTL